MYETKASAFGDMSSDSDSASESEAAPPAAAAPAVEVVAAPAKVFHPSLSLSLCLPMQALVCYLPSG